MTGQQKEQIRTMRLQGIGYIKIGKALGISDNTVRSFCRRNGLGDKSKNAVACKQCGKLIKIIPKQKPKSSAPIPVEIHGGTNTGIASTEKQIMNIPAPVADGISPLTETITENTVLMPAT